MSDSDQPLHPGNHLSSVRYCEIYWFTSNSPELVYITSGTRGTSARCQPQPKFRILLYALSQTLGEAYSIYPPLPTPQSSDLTPAVLHRQQQIGRALPIP